MSLGWGVLERRHEFVKDFGTTSKCEEGVIVEPVLLLLDVFFGELLIRPDLLIDQLAIQCLKLGKYVVDPSLSELDPNMESLIEASRLGISRL